MAKVQFNCRLEEATVARIQEAADDATAKLGVKVSQAAVLERLPTFSLERLKRLTGPCVYAWRRGSEYLYIGSTRVGLRRPFDTGHAILGKPELEDEDALDVWLCENEEQARQFERQLITDFQPAFNAQTGEGQKAGNKVVVILSDEEYSEVKRRAGLVPLSAWFRALAFPAKIDAGKLAEGLELAAKMREQRYEPPGYTLPAPHERHRAVTLDAVAPPAGSKMGKATVETWRDGRKPLLKPSQRKGK